MKRLIDLLRTFIISFEFVILIVGMGLIFFDLIPAANVAFLSSASDEKIKWMALLPVALLGLIFKDCSKLLFPEKDKKEIITGWSNYWQLRNLADVTMGYGIIFAVSGSLSWILDLSSNRARLVVLLSTSVIGSGVTYCTFHRAMTTINVIFASSGEKS